MKYKKPMRTKAMEKALRDYFSYRKHGTKKFSDEKAAFIKKWGMSPSYMKTMYRPYKPKKRVKSKKRGGS